MNVTWNKVHYRTKPCRRKECQNGICNSIPISNNQRTKRREHRLLRIWITNNPLIDRLKASQRCWVSVNNRDLLKKISKTWKPNCSQFKKNDWRTFTTLLRRTSCLRSLRCNKESLWLGVRITSLESDLSWKRNVGNLKRTYSQWMSRSGLITTWPRQSLLTLSTTPSKT